MWLGRKTRLSVRSVQLIVEKCLKLAGLDGMGFSTHKLRHTAATLLYRSGGADMLALKEILGHEHVSTTEIYFSILSSPLQIYSIRFNELFQVIFNFIMINYNPLNLPNLVN